MMVFILSYILFCSKRKKERKKPGEALQVDHLCCRPGPSLQAAEACGGEVLQKQVPSLNRASPSPLTGAQVGAAVAAACAAALLGDGGRVHSGASS